MIRVRNLEAKLKVKKLFNMARPQFNTIYEKTKLRPLNATGGAAALLSSEKRRFLCLWLRPPARHRTRLSYVYTNPPPSTPLCVWYWTMRPIREHTHIHKIQGDRISLHFHTGHTRKVLKRGFLGPLPFPGVTWLGSPKYQIGATVFRL